MLGRRRSKLQTGQSRVRLILGVVLLIKCTKFKINKKILRLLRRNKMEMLKFCH